MTTTINVTIFYDYLCPFAYRGVRLLTDIEQTRPDVTVDWRFFSLEQVNAEDRGRSEDWNLWEQPLDYEPLWRSRRGRSLAALLITHAVEQQKPAALPQFRLATFDAFHNDRADISNPDTLLTIAAQQGVDVAALTWDTTAARNRLRDDIQSGFEEGAFGVPTLVINECESTYMRLSEYPADPAERQTLFDELVHTLTRRPYVQELKRASAADY